MKVCFVALLCALLCAPARATVPSLDHVIVVIMENHGYDQVRALPYTSTLMAESVTFTQSYGITHPSFPNYLALWGGSTRGVTTNDCPPAGAPWNVDNLGHACEVAGISWRAYSEDLPSAGYTECSSDGYRRKHAPWTNFSNLNHDNERPYSELAKDIAANRLPTLAFVVPDNCNSTHDCAVTTGDDWLSANIPALLNALGPRGLLILTYDEDDSDVDNHILTVFAGNTVKPGTQHTTKVTHYNVLRTICDALGITPMGAAATASPIDGVWANPTAVAHTTLGRVKFLFRPLVVMMGPLRRAPSRPVHCKVPTTTL